MRRWGSSSGISRRCRRSRKSSRSSGLEATWLYQSAISNQIAALERLVCARLVERVRGGSSISLTEPGQVLYEHAVALIARLQAARTDVAASWPALPATLRVGYSQSVGATVLPQTSSRSASGSRPFDSSSRSATPTGRSRSSSPGASSTPPSRPLLSASTGSRRRTCSMTRSSCSRRRGRRGRSLPTLPPAAARAQAVRRAAAARECAAPLARPSPGRGRLARGCADDPGARRSRLRVRPAPLSCRASPSSRSRRSTGRGASSNSCGSATGPRRKRCWTRRRGGRHARRSS